MKAVRGLLLLAAVALAGCSGPSARDEVRRLETVGEFELYSLEPLSDPRTHEMDYDPNGPGERLHGWRILGKTTVRDEPTRRAVSEAMERGMEGQGNDAKCFYPRHAVRTTANGRTVDLLICFECGNVEVYRDGRRGGPTEAVGSDPQPILDEVLTKAGVPLAKKAERGKQQSAEEREP